MIKEERENPKDKSACRINYSFHSTITLNSTLFKLVVGSAIPRYQFYSFVSIKMTINQDKSSTLKKILKAGEDDIMTHSGGQIFH
jgi:hypothetical protein